MLIDSQLHFNDEDALSKWGREFGAQLKAGTLIALEGPLGAGKTTLIRAIVQGLEGGTAPERALCFVVQSPTFGLMHEYPTRIPVIHLDLYRLEGKTPQAVSQALDAIGFRDVLSKDNIIFVEWMSRLPTEEQNPDLWLRLAFDEKNPAARALEITQGLASSAF